jgi:hypothetical protein
MAKSTDKKTLYKVSYDTHSYDGAITRCVTAITYPTKAAAAAYAKQLNDKNYSFASNARVVKA